MSHSGVARAVSQLSLPIFTEASWSAIAGPAILSTSVDDVYRQVTKFRCRYTYYLGNSALPDTDPYDHWFANYPN